MLYDEQTVPEQLESRPCGDIQCSALRIHVLIPVQYSAVSRITVASPIVNEAVLKTRVR